MAPTITAETLEQALLRQLPPGLHKQSADLSRTLAAFINGSISAKAAQEDIVALPAADVLLHALVGREVVTPEALISFKDNDLRGATITISGDVAGGSIIKNSTITLTVPLAISLVVQIGAALSATQPLYRANVLRMAEDYQAVFGGRDGELADLDRFLEQEERPYGLLLAPTGIGKSALLIHWVARVRARGGWDVIFAPISQRYETAGAAETLIALAYALADLHGERQQVETYNMSPEQLLPQIAGYLGRQPPAGRRLLLVIDGLDEAVGWHVSRSLFPSTPASQVRVVVAARQSAHTTAADWYETLGWRFTQVRLLSLTGLSRAAIEAIVAGLAPSLPQHERFVRELARVSQGDPLTVRLLLEELLEGAGDLTIDRLTSMPPGLEAFVKSWLDELMQRSRQQPTVARLLGLCAVAFGPLSADDLRQLDPERFASQIELRAALDEVKRFIIGDGSPGSGYVFSHPRLRELFAERLLAPDEVAALRRRFVAYGQAVYERRIAHRDWQASDAPSSYLLRFWPTHLAELGQWERLAEVVADVTDDERPHIPWAEARYAAEGSYGGYLGDVELLWGHASRKRDLALAVRCALIVASIRSIAGNFSPALLAALVKVGTTRGRWSLAAALAHIRQLREPEKQVDALEVLLRAECGLNDAEALAWIEELPDDRTRAKLLAALGHHLSADRWPQALALLRRLENDEVRATALTGLAPHLPQQLWGQALQVIEKISDCAPRVALLAKTVTHLPLTLVGPALKMAERCPESAPHALLLAGVAARLPLERRLMLCTKALAMLRRLTAGSEPDTEDQQKLRRTVESMLRELAPLLPDALVPELFAFVCEAFEGYTRLSILEHLAYRLPEQQLTEALRLVRVREDSSWRAGLLATLMPHLPPQLLEEAQRLVATFYGNDRARVLAALLPRTPPSQRLEMCVAAFAAIRDDKYNESGQAFALSKLAPHLPPELLAAALDLATSLSAERDDETVQRESAQSDALGGLAPYLPPHLLETALYAVAAIRDESWRTITLWRLAPHLKSGDLLLTAMVVADTLSNPSERSVAYEILGRGRSVEQQRMLYGWALFYAQQVGDGEQGEELFEAFCPYLSGEYLTATLAAMQDDDAIEPRLLAAVAPHLPEPLLAEALILARRVEQPAVRAICLSSLAPRLPQDEQLVVYSEAVAAASAQPLSLQDLNEVRANLNELPPHMLPLLLAAAAHLSVKSDWGDALALIIPHLPNALLPGAIEVIFGLEPPAQQATALLALAPRLDQHDLAAVCRRLLAYARTCPHAADVAVAIERIAPLLPQEEIATAQEIVGRLTPSPFRSRAWSALVLRLPPAAQHTVYQQAIADIHQHTYSWWQADAWQALGPHLPDTFVPEALERILVINDEGDRIRALQPLAARLPADLARATLARVRAQDDWGSRGRSRALALLAARLPPAEQGAIYDEALAESYAIDHTLTRAGVLQRLLPHLPSSRYSEVLSQLHLLDKDQFKGWVLEGMLPNAPTELLEPILVAASDLKEFEHRKHLLALLAPRLTPALWERALALVSATPEPWARAHSLVALALHLPDTLCGAALDLIDIPGQRAITDLALTALGPRLPQELLPRALELLQLDADWLRMGYGRREAVAAILPHVRGPLLPQALDLIWSFDHGPTCAPLLAVLAPNLAADYGTITSESWPLLEQTLRRLVAYGRPTLLQGLAALAPWLAALDDTAADNILAASAAMCACWP